MSNSRQFLVPLNYDITKSVYPVEETVRKRKYLMDDIQSIEQYQQIYNIKIASNAYLSSRVYADKLRH